MLHGQAYKIIRKQIGGVVENLPKLPRLHEVVNTHSAGLVLDSFWGRAYLRTQQPLKSLEYIVSLSIFDVLARNQVQELSNQLIRNNGRSVTCTCMQLHVVTQVVTCIQKAKRRQLVHHELLHEHRRRNDDSWCNTSCYMHPQCKTPTVGVTRVVTCIHNAKHSQDSSWCNRH
jgi:hypothetical protein